MANGTPAHELRELSAKELENRLAEAKSCSTCVSRWPPDS